MTYGKQQGRQSYVTDCWNLDQEWNLLIHLAVCPQRSYRGEIPTLWYCQWYWKQLSARAALLEHLCSSGHTTTGVKLAHLSAGRGELQQLGQPFSAGFLQAMSFLLGTVWTPGLSCFYSWFRQIYLSCNNYSVEIHQKQLKLHYCYQRFGWWRSGDTSQVLSPLCCTCSAFYVPMVSAGVTPGVPQRWCVSEAAVQRVLLFIVTLYYSICKCQKHQQEQQTDLWSILQPSFPSSPLLIW